MATLYCDFQNGNDNYGGTSFALLASGTDGRINSTTFSSATASFPNDGSLIGQYLSIFNGTIYAVYRITTWVSATSLTITAISGGTSLANQTVDRQFYIGGRWKSLTSGATAVRIIPGDTVRIMGSPAPTSLGQNGVWTSQALQETKFIGSSTNATPIAITCTGHGYSTGDTVVITGHTSNTSANGTWEITVTGANTFTLDGSAGNATGFTSGTVRLRNNTRVMLTTAVTQNIASTGRGRAAWTASPSVTTTLNTATKEHVNSDSIAIAAGFTTGLAAYWALPSTLDLSGYQQVSFWIQQTTGTIGAAGTVDLRLCSDNAGVTAVNTISIPALGATGRWMPVTVDLAANLGNSIQSIALYVNTDNGAQTFLLSNIIACKASSAADSLTLTSLIGKNTTGETFWGIQSINGRRVMLDADTNAAPTSLTARGYYGTSETVTTWKRETIKLGPAAASNTVLQTIQESGSGGSPITFSGGWDRTSMNTQSLETWTDGLNGYGYGLNISSKSWVIVEKIAFVRFNVSLDLISATNCTLNVIASNNFGPISATGSIQLSGGSNFNTLNIGSCVASAGTGIIFSAHDNELNISGILASHPDRAVYLDSFSQAARVKGSGTMALVANNVAGFEMNGAIAFVKDIAFASNAYDIDLLNSNGYRAFFKNVILESAVEINQTSDNNHFIQSQNHDQIANNHLISGGGARITSAIDQRHTESGISWKIQVTSTLRISSWPVVLSLAKVAVNSNSPVTVKAWMRRTNVGLTMRLVCKGGQIDGVANDVVSSMTAAADTWEELTIAFTPTEIGVVEITAEAWGGTTYSGWVDDMSISQAV